MAFRYKSGPLKLDWWAKKASTAFAVGDLVYMDGSGEIQLADSTSGDHIGVCLKAVASTDSDYASTTRIPVIRVGEDVIFEADVGTGTMTQNLEGTYCDLKDENELDVSATSKNVIFLKKFLSSTKALCVVSAHATDRRVATT